MKHQLNKKTKQQISKMDLTELVTSASLVAADIGQNIVHLGGILNEISERYGAEGIDLTCKTLGLNKRLFAKMIATYRGIMHPSVALGSVPHCKKLEDLTLEQQSDIIERGALYVEKNGRTYRNQRIPLSKLDTQQIDQLFDGTRLRTEDEQVQFLKDRENPKPKPKRNPKPPYELRKGKLIVYRPITFTKETLIQFTAEM